MFLLEQRGDGCREVGSFPDFGLLNSRLEWSVYRRQNGPSPQSGLSSTTTWCTVATVAKSAGLMCMVSKQLCSTHELSWHEPIPGRLLHVRVHGVHRSFGHSQCISTCSCTTSFGWAFRSLASALNFVGHIATAQHRHVAGRHEHLPSSTYRCSGTGHVCAEPAQMQGTQTCRHAFVLWTSWQLILLWHSIHGNMNLDQHINFPSQDQFSRIDYICCRQHMADATSRQVVYLHDFPLIDTEGFNSRPHWWLPFWRCGITVRPRDHRAGRDHRGLISVISGNILLQMSINYNLRFNNQLLPFHATTGRWIICIWHWILFDQKLMPNRTIYLIILIWHHFKVFRFTLCPCVHCRLQSCRHYSRHGFMCNNAAKLVDWWSRLPKMHGSDDCNRSTMQHDVQNKPGTHSGCGRLYVNLLPNRPSVKFIWERTMEIWCTLNRQLTICSNGFLNSITVMTSLTLPEPLSGHSHVMNLPVALLSYHFSKTLDPSYAPSPFWKCAASQAAELLDPLCKLRSQRNDLPGVWGQGYLCFLPKAAKGGITILETSGR